MADFIVEFTGLVDEKVESSECPFWELYVDGSSSEQKAGAGIILISPEGHKILYALRFKFKATNNEAEYEALLAGLRLVREVRAERVKIYSDSQLVVCQVREEYQAKGSKMAIYLQKIRELLAGFEKYELQHVPRSQNSHADALACLATAKDADFIRAVPIEVLPVPST